jgi:hypothetical protein
METLNINGRDVNVDAPPDMPLLWTLRDVLGMTGTKLAADGAVRHLHGPGRQKGNAFLHNANIGAVRQAHHHNGGNRQHISRQKFSRRDSSLMSRSAVRHSD